MRHKISIEERLERLESKLKKMGFLISRNENTDAFNYIEVLLEEIENIRSLLRNETQD